MKVRKAFKKVAALGIGVSMLGATVTGALAADLNEYPNPLFIKDGKFNGVIVIGDTAMPQDTLGAIDVATGLQFSSTTSAKSGSSSVTISEGAKIEKSGNTFNIDESIADIESSLDSSDLPTVLADGVYDESEGNTDNDEDYTQEITFFDGTASLVLDQDDDDADMGGLYLKIDKNEDLYNYTLEFDSEADYDDTSTTTAKADFETSKIEIQGNLYTFTNVKLASGVIDELTLQAGDTTVWLEQAQPVTRIIGGEEVEVELVDVNENEDKCGILVDGQLEWVDVGSTESASGVEIGVTDAITVHSEGKDTDVCEVNVGASEIKLRHEKEVQINGKDVDGSTVVFDESTAGELESISISYEADEDVYMAEGDSWQDPVLGNFEINFAQINVNAELIDLDVSGEDMTLSFNNIDGKEVEIPFYCAGSCDGASDAIYVGTDSAVDERYYFEGGACLTSDITDCEGARFLVNEGDEVHVIEVENLDESDAEITLKDVTYGGSKTSDIVNGTSNSVDLPAGGDTVTLGVHFGSGYVIFSDSDIVGVADTFQTEYEGLLSLSGLNASGESNFNNTYNLTVTLSETEGEEDSSTENVLSTVSFLVDVDTADEELDINAPTVGNASANSPVDVSDENDNDKVYYSLYGTKIVYDSEEERSAKVYFPEEELAADVFVSPVGANIVTTSVSGAVNIQKIEVGSAKLASNVGSLEGQNTIIVGGPCVNQLAAEFLGITMDSCMEGAPEVNTAVISLKEMGDKVALLVNGYAAADTQRASYVLSNYDDYDLMGSEVVVSGTDYSNIQISAMQ